MNNEPQRPNPDLLLDKLEAEAAKARRGKLKIFFGSSAGVGKTYAMLSAAHEQVNEGVDVVAGVVETHKRPETEKLLEGLPMMEPLKVEYHSIVMRELDLEAAKKRHPKILLVDELAHTNAPGLAHPKRWNDVVDLLDAGIDVYTTLNVQHIESLSDIVAGTTGVWVKEAVPDIIFDMADDIVLVDIDADDLLKRLNEGKVYVAESAMARAAENFFRKSNLIALRELALRRTAERVDAQMQAYNDSEGISGGQPVAEKIMVCLGPQTLSLRLAHGAKRIANGLKAPWVGLYIEGRRHRHLTERGKRALEALFRLVERMGGKMVILHGEDALEEIISYAKKNRVTKIIVGKTIAHGWRSLFRRSLADRIIRSSGAIDVFVITSNEQREDKVNEKQSIFGTFKPMRYVASLAMVAACTLFGLVLRDYIAPIDQALIYLMGIVIVAIKFGSWPSLFYLLMSIGCFSTFFVMPNYGLDVGKHSYLMTFLVMLIAGNIISRQASRLRLQAIFSRNHAQHLQVLYDLTRELSSKRGRHAISEVVAKQIAGLFPDVEVTVWIQDADGQLAPFFGDVPEATMIKETGVLQWCFDNGKLAGRGTTTMPSAAGLYFPLLSTENKLGVLGVIPKDPARAFMTEEISTLETLASLFSSALDRVKEAEDASVTRIEVEREKLRNTLLSSVSHDLRTPLVNIGKTAVEIVHQAEHLQPDAIKTLARSINQETVRLSQIVNNLLDVSSLESGAVQLNCQTCFVEELINASLVRLKDALAKHIVATGAARHLPMVLVDRAMIEQVLVNLLENAAKYTVPGSTIVVAANKLGDEVLMSVDDTGPGIPLGDEKKIFEKFYTVDHDIGRHGTGLGLAICDGIIKAHGGRIWMENRPEGGASFYFTLPTVKAPEEKISPNDPSLAV